MGKMPDKIVALTKNSNNYRTYSISCMRCKHFRYVESMLPNRCIYYHNWFRVETQAHCVNFEALIEAE